MSRTLDPKLIDDAVKLLFDSKNPVTVPKTKNIEHIAMYAPAALAAGYGLINESPWYEDALLVGGTLAGGQLLSNLRNKTRQGFVREAMNDDNTYNYFNIRNRANNYDVENLAEDLASYPAFRNAVEATPRPGIGDGLFFGALGASPALLLNTLLPNPKEEQLLQEAIAYQQQNPNLAMMEY